MTLASSLSGLGLEIRSPCRYNGEPLALGNLRNNLAYLGTAVSNMDGANAQFNSWNLSVSVSDDDFESISSEGWDAPRQADGSLPVLARRRGWLGFRFG